MELAGIDDSGGEFWPTTFAEPDSVTAFVPVIHGCDKFCTYCIVPYRRGREKSRTIDDIRNEVEHYCARGVREVTLLGQTVEAYGHDLRTPDEAMLASRRPDLGDLMRAIHDVPGLERIRFLTSYPKDMTARIIDAVAELPKVCENFNIPVQSGDDAVLERMRRGYTLDEYLEKFELVRARMPDAAMVDRHHRRLLRRDRRGVPAHVRPARAPALRQGARRRVLAAPRHDRAPHAGRRRAGRGEAGAAAARSSSWRRASRSRSTSGSLTREQQVLVESRREGRWSGRNRLGKLVHFEGDADIGQMVDVRIEHATAWSLQGTALPATVPV